MTVRAAEPVRGALSQIARKSAAEFSHPNSDHSRISDKSDVRDACKLIRVRFGESCDSGCGMTIDPPVALRIVISDAYAAGNDFNCRAALGKPMRAANQHCPTLTQSASPYASSMPVMRA